MKIRKYVARSMPEALQQVRDDLGEQAVILSTRQLRKGSRFNQAEEARVEVTAAYDQLPAAAIGSATSIPPSRTAVVANRGQPGTPPPTVGDGTSDPGRQGARPGGLVAQRYGQSRPQIPVPTQTRAQELPQAAADSATAPTPASVAAAETLETMAAELRGMQQALACWGRERQLPGLAIPEAVTRVQARLGNVGMGPELVDEVVAHLFAEMNGKALADRLRVGERAAAFLAHRLPRFKDIRLGRQRKVVGFFGAAGVGKTTAVAKIAAGFAARQGRRIVIICADEQRVGAADQARAFADIIGVPMELASNEAAVSAALERHAQARLVLLDAPGCGPHDQRGCEWQRRLFAAAGVDQVQVVMDAKSSLEHMLDQIEASSAWAERRLLFTKMDETARSGAVLSAVATSGLSASYFTTGPDVPGAIEAGDCRRLAARLMGISSAATRSRS